MREWDRGKERMGLNKDSERERQRGERWVKEGYWERKEEKDR